jgi:SOS-response transcriptional repressor LexA
MSWATRTIEELGKGKVVQIRPHGNSMSGKIESGDLVTIQPVINEELQKGDIVLCRVKGNDYLHLIKSIDNDGRCLIGNNKGGINGWASRVFGKVIKVEA